MVKLFFLAAIGLFGSASVMAAEGPAGPVSSAWEIFRAGGAVMWLLLASSMVGVTFALERAVALRAAAHAPADLAEKTFWLKENKGVEEAMAFAKASRSSLGRVLETVLSHYRGSRQEVEQAVDGELGRILSDERRCLRPIGVVGTMAPLMGLLGTVIGMIDAFRQAAAGGMGNAANFAGGIYQALYTTAFGLMVSLLLLGVYHWLRGRLERLLRTVEDRALAFVHQDFYAAAPVMALAETGEIAEEVA